MTVGIHAKLVTRLAEVDELKSTEAALKSEKQCHLEQMTQPTSFRDRRALSLARSSAPFRFKGLQIKLPNPQPRPFFAPFRVSGGLQHPRPEAHCRPFGQP